MFQLRSNFAFIFDRQLASFFTRKNESIWEILNKLRFLDNSFFFFVFTKSCILLSAVPEFSNQVTVCALAVKTSAYVIPFRGTSSRPKAYKLKYSFVIPLYPYKPLNKIEQNFLSSYKILYLFVSSPWILQSINSRVDLYVAILQCQRSPI